MRWAEASASTRSYFFFSLWTVCFRSRGDYFFTLSFSPPDFRRSV